MNASITRVCRRAMLSTAIVFALATPGMTLAQSAAVPATPAADEKSGGSTSVEDIVVTARRSAENQQSVPIAITTVTAQRLRDLGVRDLVDVQKVTPGLYISTVQVAGKARISIRGQVDVDDRLLGERAVGAYIDGVVFSHTYGLTSALVDLEQIEVLKGPQGTLFGRNTTAGALNITTQHPTYDWGGYVDLQYGSYNKMQGLAVINAPVIDGKLAVRAVGQIISREGYYHEFNGQESATDYSGYGRLSVRADPAANVRILLTADFTRFRNSAGHGAVTFEALQLPANITALQAIATQLGLNPAVPANLTTAYNAFRVYYDAMQRNPRLGFGKPQASYDNLQNWSVSSNIAVDIGSVTAKSITGYRELDRSQFSDLDDTPFDLLISRQNANLNAFSQEFQLSSIDGEGLDWQTGLYYSHETGDDVSIGDTFVYVSRNRAAVQDSGVVNTSKAAYAQAVYNLSSNWRVTGGIRYTKDYKKIISRNRIELALALPPLPAGGASTCAQLAPALGGPVFPNCGYTASTRSARTTWLASTDWRPVPEVMLYGSVSTGYRAGGFTQPGTAVIPSQAALTATFTPYRPESVTNYEVGFKSDLFDRRLRINGSFYYLDYKNIQVSTRNFVNNILLTIINNAASATLYGGELEVTAVPADGLTLTASTGYLHAKYNKYLARDAAGNVTDLSAQAFPVPRWTANAGASYEIPVPDGSINLNANYAWIDDNLFSNSVTNLASATQKAYGLLDARISWNIESQGLNIAVFGNNLTDKIYYASIAPAGPINIGQLGNPRTYGIQVRKTF